MAYVRLSLNLGPYRQLETRDPYRIAAALHRSPRPGRNYRLIPALIYSAHALSIPVRLGIDHVARSQAFFWSVRHSIAGFECAILLSKWLLSLADPGSGQNLSGTRDFSLLQINPMLTLTSHRKRKPYPPLDPLHRARVIRFNGHGRRRYPPRSGARYPWVSCHQALVSFVSEEYAMAIHQPSRREFETVSGYTSGLSSRCTLLDFVVFISFTVLPVQVLHGSCWP